MSRKYNNSKRKISNSKRELKKLSIKFTKHNVLIFITIILTMLSILFTKIPIIEHIVDIIIFTVLLFITLKCTLLSISRINVINLSSDLNLWSLRILGIVMGIIGFIVFSIPVLSITLSEVSNVPLSFHIVWIVGLCIFIIGVFCNFRATRRYEQTIFMR